MSIHKNAGAPILLPFRRLFPGWPRRSLSSGGAIDPIRLVSTRLRRYFPLLHAAPGAPRPDIPHIAGFTDSPRIAPRMPMAQPKSS
jgi:hypothetical protein